MCVSKVQVLEKFISEFASDTVTLNFTLTLNVVFLLSSFCPFPKPKEITVITFPFAFLHMSLLRVVRTIPLWVGSAYF